MKNSKFGRLRGGEWIAWRSAHPMLRFIGAEGARRGRSSGEDHGGHFKIPARTRVKERDFGRNGRDGIRGIHCARGRGEKGEELVADLELFTALMAAFGRSSAKKKAGRKEAVTWQRWPPHVGDRKRKER